MILKVFTVYDSATLAFLPPFFCRSKGEAIRSFTQAVMDEGHQFAKHKSDYALFELGEFDDSSAAIAVSQVPVRVITALEVGNGTA